MRHKRQKTRIRPDPEWTCFIIYTNIDVVDPKKYPNKVHTGPKGSKRLLCIPGKTLTSSQQTLEQRVN